ncbi:MAG TPA: FxsA family protein [Methylotenera sp.]|nr:FxsA family protein [Methylotenera sp.]
MRFVILLALLALPVAEIWTLIILGDLYGWWVVLYLVAMIVLGLQLIRNEKHLFTARIMQSLAQNQHPVKAMFGSARNIIAGILLIIPGVITDIAAAILLLLPTQQPALSSKTYSQDSAKDFAKETFRTPEDTFTEQTSFNKSKRFNQKPRREAANDDVIEGEFHREE